MPLYYKNITSMDLLVLKCPVHNRLEPIGFIHQLPVKVYPKQKLVKVILKCHHSDYKEERIYRLTSGKPRPRHDVAYFMIKFAPYIPIKLMRYYVNIMLWIHRKLK